LAPDRRADDGELEGPALFHALIEGRSLGESPPRVDGRLDLRGVRLGLGDDAFREDSGDLVRRFREGTRPLFIEDMTIEGVDFSNGDLSQVSFVDTTIRNCRFDRASLLGLRIVRSEVVDVSFDRADLRMALLGSSSGRRTRFGNVTFRGAKMIGSYPGAEFEDCDFSRAQLTRVEFRNCVLRRCRFAGPLSGTVFYSRRHLFRHEESLQDVDFTEAELRGVAFRGLNLDAVRLPDDRRHILFGNPACTLGRAIEAIRDRDDIDARGMRAVLQDHRRHLGPKQRIGILGRHDLVPNESSAKTEAAIALIRRAEATCRQPN
jgi:uncharacterized protein YjbI with pentapeptide repeats